MPSLQTLSALAHPQNAGATARPAIPRAASGANLYQGNANRTPSNIFSQHLQNQVRALLWLFCETPCQKCKILPLP